MTVTYILTQDEENAVTAIIARINTQPVPTVQSYVNARVRELFSRYVEQELSLEVDDVVTSYRLATPAKRNAAKAAL